MRVGAATAQCFLSCEREEGLHRSKLLCTELQLLSVAAVMSSVLTPATRAYPRKSQLAHAARVSDGVWTIALPLGTQAGKSS